MEELNELMTSHERTSVELRVVQVPHDCSTEVLVRGDNATKTAQISYKITKYISQVFSIKCFLFLFPVQPS